MLSSQLMEQLDSLNRDEKREAMKFLEAALRQEEALLKLLDGAEINLPIEAEPGLISQLEALLRSNDERKSE